MDLQSFIAHFPTFMGGVCIGYAIAWFTIIQDMRKFRARLDRRDEVFRKRMIEIATKR